MAEELGHEWWVLGATATCDCGWVGLAGTQEEVTSMWIEHAHRAGHPETMGRVIQDG